MDKLNKDRRREKSPHTTSLQIIILLITFFLGAVVGTFAVGEEIIEMENLKIPEGLLIEFHNLTNTEKDVATLFLKEISPIYFKDQRKIVFTKNIYDEIEHEFEDEVYGFNLNNGEIYVSFNESISIIKGNLCHELLHTYDLDYDCNHEFLDNLAEMGVCYR